MIEGARWRKWVFFYVPMALFLLFLLFPFYWMVITSVRPDGELYRPWNSINYNPFWTWKPTWDHVRYLFEETLFASWLWNTTFIALMSTAISLVCGVFAGYALSRLTFPFAGSLGTGSLAAPYNASRDLKDVENYSTAFKFTTAGPCADRR